MIENIETYTKEQAKIYSEGNKELEKLLYYCLDNKIYTKACCAGHYFKDYNSYIEHIMTHHIKKNEITREKVEKTHPKEQNFIPYIVFYYEENAQEVIRRLCDSVLLDKYEKNIRYYKKRNSYDITIYLCNGFLWYNLNITSQEEIDAMANAFFNDIQNALEENDKIMENKDNEKNLYALNTEINNIAHKFDIEFYNIVCEDNVSVDIDYN